MHPAASDTRVEHGQHVVQRSAKLAQLADLRQRRSAIEVLAEKKDRGKPVRDSSTGDIAQQVRLADPDGYPRFRLVTAAFLQVISMLRLM